MLKSQVNALWYSKCVTLHDFIDLIQGGTGAIIKENRFLLAQVVVWSSNSLKAEYKENSEWRSNMQIKHINEKETSCMIFLCPLDYGSFQFLHGMTVIEKSFQMYLKIEYDENLENFETPLFSWTVSKKVRVGFWTGGFGRRLKVSLKVL